MFTRILIGVDGGPGGRDALALARLLAAPSAQLTAVHVAHEARRGAALDAHLYETVLAAELTTTGVAAEKLVVDDRYAGRALRLATERARADLLVVGSSRQARPTCTFAGDTARTALHGSHCAVATATRGLHRASLSACTIGVGFDGSPEARQALDIARRLAWSTAGSVHLMAVGAPPGHVPATAPDGRPRTAVDQQRPASSEAMVAAAARTIAAGGIEVRAEVVSGPPAARLERLSEHVDLLVLGSRGYGPASRTLLGATADRLLRTAHCPVIVVPRGTLAGVRATATAQPLVTAR